ncbi:hypothetical protein TNCV_59681 [Trichonephila clavipes]|nr:hypothetical protein TNCV_59681 [Trichonephila clavipes]
MALDMLRIDVLPLSTEHPDEPRHYQLCLPNYCSANIIASGRSFRSRCLVHASMLTAVHRQRKLGLAHQYRNWKPIE